MEACRPILCLVVLARVWHGDVFGAVAAAGDQPLLLLGKPIAAASLVSCDTNGVFEFRVGEQTLPVSGSELVRWGAPAANSSSHEVILVDGSRLVLAPAWSGKPTWRVTAESVSIRTQLLGEVALPRSLVRAILVNAPTDPPRRAQLVDQLTAAEGPLDLVVLVNGDVVEGTCYPRTGQTEPTPIGVPVALASRAEPVVVPLAGVAGIAFGNAAPRTADALLVIGLRDGSLVRAAAVVGGAEQVKLSLASGIELAGIALREIVYLRSLAADTIYLSDQPPADFRHVPYLALSWPLRADRNALGSPLAVNGRRYAKGLGMHTAARVTYDLASLSTLSGGAPQRLVAWVAVDDAAEGGGSVIFRVYLLSEGRWREAFASPIVRGGDEPLSVSVDLAGASRIALVSDFADRGDQRDYADWLDARLE